MTRRRKRLKMPDERAPLRALISTLPGLVGLAALALAAWAFRPVSVREQAERAVDRAERATELEVENGP